MLTGGILRTLYWHFRKKKERVMLWIMTLIFSPSFGLASCELNEGRIDGLVGSQYHICKHILSGKVILVIKYHPGGNFNLVSVFQLLTWRRSRGRFS